MRLNDKYADSCHLQPYYTIFHTAFQFFFNVIAAELYITDKTLILTLHHSNLWYYLMK